MIKNNLHKLIFFLILLFSISPYFVIAALDNSVAKTINTGNLKEFQNYIKKGIDVNSKNPHGETLLMQALRSRKGTSIAKWLIDNGADINLRSGNKLTALSVATMNNNRDIIELLVQKGANINDSLSPPIFWSTRNLETLKTLLDLGADINLKSTGRNKETVLKHYIRDSNSKTMFELLNNNIDISDSSVIINHGTKVAEFMIEHGISPNKLDKKGESVLFNTNDLAMAELLLSKGANSNIRRKRDGATVLILRRFDRDSKFTKLLMNYGADPEIKDNYGKTAFDYTNDIISEAALFLETAKYYSDNSYNKNMNERRRKILNAQIRIDIMNSKPGKTFSTSTTAEERKRKIAKYFLKFKKLRGSNRIKEFGFLILSQFSPPSSLVGHIVDCFSPKTTYSEDDIIELFGPLDKKDKDGNIYYYLGCLHKRYYYAFFEMNQGKLYQVSVIPEKEPSSPEFVGINRFRQFSSPMYKTALGYKTCTLIHIARKIRGCSQFIVNIVYQIQEIIMVRPLRVEYPGACYHVINRGNRREQIFFSENDYKLFIEKLSVFSELFDVIIHCYGLMPNHFHLMLMTKNANLSKFMQLFTTSFTISMNNRYHKPGHLFQGRYKAQLVESKLYKNDLSRYIHLNPVKVKSCEDLSLLYIKKYLHNYRWSSFQNYIGIVRKPKWLNRNYVLSDWGETSSEKIIHYRHFVEEGLLTDNFQKLEDSCVKSIIGTDSFRDKILKKYLTNKDRLFSERQSLALGI